MFLFFLIYSVNQFENPESISKGFETHLSYLDLELLKCLDYLNPKIQFD